jgi:hypothetical protein
VISLVSKKLYRVFSPAFPIIAVFRYQLIHSMLLFPEGLSSIYKAIISNDLSIFLCQEASENLHHGKIYHSSFIKPSNGLIYDQKNEN